MTRPVSSQLVKAQGGFAIIAAIFILVVLAALGAVMVTLSGTQHQGSAIVIETSRAQAAARSGIEWGAWQALEQSSCSPSSQFELNEGVLDGFRLTVQCSQSNHNERGEDFPVYEIIAVAERGQSGRPDYVKRELRAQFVGGS